MHNLFEDLPDQLPSELVETLLKTESIRIERIVSDGHASDPGFWYDQAENEWIALLTGSGVLRFERPEETVHLRPGDFMNIPAQRKHRVEATDAQQKTVWLAIFY